MDASLGSGDTPDNTSPSDSSRQAVLLAALFGVVGTLVVVLLIGAPLALMHRQDLPLETTYGSAVISLAARIESGNATNPLANNQRAMQAGRDAYTGSCASCHGADGKGNGVYGQATYPPATDLTAGNAREKSDAELFWITKHGLSFTGMPGFGNQYNDQDIWSLVSYLRALQNGQPQALQVPQTTKAQLEQADPNGNAVQRGAAIYFAQGCADCHGAVGNAPANLALRGSGETGAIRRGRPGMAAYGQDQMSNSELNDLEAYMATFSGQRQGAGAGESGRGGGGDG
ncbi:MAG TPA: c-type cytochrome [Chloroflexota bacterium]|nr:c-type cytochrome [Chloroflexota bacterium]